MKKNHVAPLLALFVVLSCSRAFAQDLTVDSGFTQQSLADIQASTGGFDTDSSGNIYYAGYQDSDPTEDNQVVEMTQASNYAFSTVIVDYGTSTYPSFLTLQGSTLYYGDSVNVNETSIPVLTPQAPTVIANMPDNYDMAFSGATTLVSANIDGGAAFLPESDVYSVSLTSGSYQEILSTADYSGPIRFDSSGDLLYGASGAAAVGGGIYEFTQSQLNSAITSGTALQLSQGNMIISNSGNSDFVVVGDDLFDAFNPYSQTGEVSTLTEYNLLTGAVTNIGSLANEGLYFTGMSYLNGDLIVAETDGGFGNTYTDFIQIAPIPEPRSTWLAAFGFLAVVCFHRRHPRRSLP